MVIALYVAGAFFMLVGLSLSIYFLRHQNTEDSVDKLRKDLIPYMTTTNTELLDIRKLLEEIRVA